MFVPEKSDVFGLKHGILFVFCPQKNRFCGKTCHFPSYPLWRISVVLLFKDYKTFKFGQYFTLEGTRNFVKIFEGFWRIPSPLFRGFQVMKGKVCNFSAWLLGAVPVLPSAGRRGPCSCPVGISFRKIIASYHLISSEIMARKVKTGSILSPNLKM